MINTDSNESPNGQGKIKHINDLTRIYASKNNPHKNNMYLFTPQYLP